MALTFVKEVAGTPVAIDVLEVAGSPRTAKLRAGEVVRAEGEARGLPHTLVDELVHSIMDAT